MARRDVPNRLVVLAHLLRWRRNNVRTAATMHALGYPEHVDVPPPSDPDPHADERPTDTLARWTGQPRKVCERAQERAFAAGFLHYGTSLDTAWPTDRGVELAALGASGRPKLDTVAEVEAEGARTAATLREEAHA